MKKILTLAAALMVFGATASMAQSGLNLNWDGCTADVHSSTKSFLCNTNAGTAFAMFASIVVPTDMPKFAASSCIIDLVSSGSTIPAWWQTGTGQCRANAIGMSFDPAVLGTTCGDLWGGSVNLGVFAVQPSVHGLANEVRLNGGAAIPAGSEIAVVADGATELNVAKITINRSKTVGTGNCAGCQTGVCFVLNECKLQQPDPMPNYTVTNPAVGNFVTWNAGAPACPQATPAQNRTWGAVKNLYR